LRFFHFPGTPSSNTNVILGGFFDQVGVVILPIITHRMATDVLVGIPSASSQMGDLDEEQSREASDVSLHFWILVNMLWYVGRH
jgi:hypothetical protein